LANYLSPTELQILHIRLDLKVDFKVMVATQ
jgi:hypothetical protein